MIRRLLLSSVALATISASAFAADLPARRAPPVYVPPPVAVFSWTGAYIGINAGYTFQDRTNYTLTGNDPASRGRIFTTAVAPNFRTQSNGFTGGGQIGYNFELGGAGFPLGAGLFPGGGLGFPGGGLVGGIEADAAYTDARKFSEYGALNNAVTNYRSRLDYLGTVRGRVGVAFGTLLVYGTGGFAYGGVNDSVAIGNAGGGIAYFGNRSTTRYGYAAGGGVEYAIPVGSFINPFNSSAVTVKAEYLHYDIGQSTMAVIGAGGSSYTARVQHDGNLVRAGLNYKLNFLQPAPVVARY